MTSLPRLAGLSLVLLIAACADNGGKDGDGRSDGGGGTGGDGGMQNGGDGGSSGDGGPQGGDGGGGGNPGIPGCLTDCPDNACGYVPDDCGGFLTCGACPDGQICGLVEPVRCAVAPAECTGSDQCHVIGCTPKSCEDLGHTCGLASDGCGNIINCWPSCSTSDPGCSGSCGEVASCLADENEVQSCVAGTGGCTGALCDNLPSGCASDSPTQLDGTVRTPGMYVDDEWINQLPVPNAIVYIPSDPSVALPSIFEGVDASEAASCGRCEDEELVADGQSVLAAAVTNFKGEFSLKGRIPVGAAFKLVVKVGKWRRVVEVPSGVSVACEAHPLGLESTRLPATPSDGLAGTHLPKIAVSTGDVDAMECVLRGMGIAESQFTVPSGNGRIHMYRANGTRMGSSSSDVSVTDTTLYASQEALNAYDMVVFDCEGGGRYVRGETQRNRLLAYTNAGGRVFASHWSYQWLDETGTLDDAASWTLVDSTPSSATAYVSLPTGATMRDGANPVKSLLYRDWLVYQGALSGTTAGDTDPPATPQLTIRDPRDVGGATVGASTDEWLYRTSSGAKVQQLSFNTPYGSADDQICGRVAFSAFHVATAPGGGTLDTGNLYFPEECADAELTPQEKTLAFMLFDLAACVTVGDPPAPPVCNPKTAEDLCPNENDACGYLSDRCGGVVDCGGCAAGYYCDGNTCRMQQCTPNTCEGLGYMCGQASDGCLGLLNCGECETGFCMDGACVSIE